MTARFTYVRVEHITLDEAVAFVEDARDKTLCLEAEISMRGNGLCALELSWSSAVPASTFAALAIVTGAGAAAR